MKTKKKTVVKAPAAAPAPPALSIEMLRAEHARLRDVQDKLWSDFNQATGAANQLELLISYMEGGNNEK